MLTLKFKTFKLWFLNLHLILWNNNNIFGTLSSDENRNHNGKISYISVFQFTTDKSSNIYNTSSALISRWKHTKYMYYYSYHRTFNNDVYYQIYNESCITGLYDILHITGNIIQKVSHSSQHSIHCRLLHLSLTVTDSTSH